MSSLTFCPAFSSLNSFCKLDYLFLFYLYVLDTWCSVFYALLANRVYFTFTMCVSGNLTYAAKSHQHILPLYITVPQVQVQVQVQDQVQVWLINLLRISHSYIREVIYVDTAKVWNTKNINLLNKSKSLYIWFQIFGAVIIYTCYSPIYLL